MPSEHSKRPEALLAFRALFPLSLPFAWHRLSNETAPTGRWSAWWWAASTDHKRAIFSTN